MLAIADWGMMMPGMVIPVGPLDPPTLKNVIKLSYLGIPLWALSMALTKAGLAITLLPITYSKLGKICLRVIIVLQVIFVVGNVPFVLLQCRPLAAAWDPSISAARCLLPNTFRIVSTTSSIINIVTDFALCAAPVDFLLKLQRPRAEKLFLAFLMCVGLFASGASIRKLVLVQAWVKEPSLVIPLSIAICTFTAIEALLAATAGSAVCLKAALRRFMMYMGWYQTNSTTLGSLQVSRTESIDIKQHSTPSKSDPLQHHGPGSPITQVDDARIV